MSANNNQNNGGFQSGFLIKDKSGHLKKVQDDKVVDAPAFNKPKTPPPPPQTPAPPSVQTPPPVIKIEPEDIELMPDSKIVPETQINPQGKPIAPTKPASLLVPAEPVSSSSKASFYLEPEDEEEIKKHTQDLKQILDKQSDDPRGSAKEIASQIIQRHDLHFPSEVIQKRFFKVVESRLGDFRNSIETQEVMTRSIKIGGLELPAELVSKIVPAIEKEMAAIHKPVPKAEEILTDDKPESTYAPPPPEFVPRPGEKVQSVEPAVEEQEIKPPVIIPSEKPKEKIVQPESVKEPESMPQAQLKPEAAKPAPAVDQPHELYGLPDKSMPQRSAMVRPEPQRPQVIDIKQPQKVVGPIEELADLDIKEFRRIGISPQESADKVFEKIGLLEDDSWKLRTDGIKAWRRSETNKFYIELGKESIMNDININEAIKRRQQKGAPHLLAEEFFAINSLNKKLSI